MADESGKGGQDLNIDEAARAAAAGGTGTQTPEGGSGSGAGNGKSDKGNAGGTGTEGGSEGEGSGADPYAPDADGKYTHPENKTKVDAPAMIAYLKEKFGASTAGAQELLSQNNTIKSERDTAQGTIAKLEKDMADLRLVAEGKNPEGLKAADIQAQLAKTSEELALIKESSSLDVFEKSVPLASGKVRESLKALARANPKESLQSLYDTHLKAGAEAAEAKRVADEEARKKGAGDKGKGTSTREPASGGHTVSGTRGDTGLSLEEFNALPVMKRKALIDKYGIS